MIPFRYVFLTLHDPYKSLFHCLLVLWMEEIIECSAKTMELLQFYGQSFPVRRSDTYTLLVERQDGDQPQTMKRTRLNLLA